MKNFRKIILALCLVFSIFAHGSPVFAQVGAVCNEAMSNRFYAAAQIAVFVSPGLAAIYYWQGRVHDCD